MKHLLLALAVLLPAAGWAAAPAFGNRPSLPNGVAPCESCHGAHGEGNPELGAPRIAAQSPAYLVRQLASFADGRRGSQIMTPIAKSLDEKLRKDLAAYYAAQEAPRATAKPGAGIERGRTLAARGDNGRRIQACDNCHGPDGIGEPPTYPYLGGQQRGYIVAALKAWRDGSRRTDPTAQMPTIAKRLSDEDIAALADYYATMAPPLPDTFQFAGHGPPKVPPTATVSPQQKGAAGRAGSETPGVGSEQGTPTTGGSEGPGGGGATNNAQGR